MSYFKNIKQDVVADSNNSSTTNLASGTYFTGAATSTLGVVGIQVSLKADQNCAVYVDQSPDGTNWDIVDTYNYYSAIGNFGITVQAINSYVRIRVLNKGTATTTYFRLQTALCPMVEAVPRSLSINGYLRTQIHSIKDSYEFEAENTPTNELRTVIPTRLIGTQFEGNVVDTNFWSVSTVGSGTVTQGGAEAILVAGTDANSSGYLYTVRRARYVSGASNSYRSVMQLDDTGIDSNYRRWGVAYSTSMPVISEGAYFQLSGSNFSVVTMKNGTSKHVDNGSFNGTLGNTWSPGVSCNTYEIYWTNSKVWFTIGGEVLHTVNAALATWSNTMNHHIYMSNVNVGNTTSVNLRSRVASIRRLGQLTTLSQYGRVVSAANYIFKRGPGTLHKITINTPQATGTINVYDNVAVTGSTIAIIDVATGASPATLDYDLPFTTGLAINAVGTWDATVIYE